MRTYTRKRTEYEFIEGVHEMCRLCMEKAKETVPIFSDSDNVCASLTMRIMICVGLEITREDCLPNMICTECHKELNNYYEFKKRCLLTYQKLKSHVLAVKQAGTTISNEKDTSLNLNERNDLKTCDRLSNKNDLILNVCGNQNLGANTVLNGQTHISNNIIIEKPSTDLRPSNLSAPIHRDMSEFVSSILLELGVLSREGDQIVLTDDSVGLMEIETGDDSKIVLEMLEVDEEPQSENNNNISCNEVNVEPVIKFVVPAVTESPALPTKKEAAARCAQCGKRFASSGALRRHARVHSGERPFPCALCGRAFAQREVLRRHELVHREERPFRCGQCAKSFTQRGALAAHARSHAAPQARALALHRCTRCPKVFLHASGLSRHTRVHSGRVFACVACERQFSDKSSLLRHLRNKHPHLAAKNAAD